MESRGIDRRDGIDHQGGTQETRIGEAVAVLQQAIESVGNRGSLHGDMGENFRIAANLWNAYLYNKNRGSLGSIKPMDVVAMMVLLKLSRVMAGDSKHADHYVDMAGYASIMAVMNINKE